jgi:NitT/TauT family transport system substrate-binding protein
MGRYLLVVAALVVALGVPMPALADDVLNVIGNSSPLSIYAVTDDTALYGGFFKEEHLDVNIIYKNEPGKVGTALIGTQAVADSEADIATTSLEPALLGYGKGLRLQAFFSRDPQYEFVLAVPTDSPIRTLADFKGKTIGELTPNSTAEIVTATLAGAGLKRSDFTYLPVGQGAPAVAALTARKVDALAFPYVALVGLEVSDHLTFRYFWDPIIKDVSDVSYSATPATIQNKPDLLGRYARAIVKAAIAVRENPQFAAACFLRGAGLPINAESLQNETLLLERIQDHLPAFDPFSKRIGYLPPRSIDTYVNFLVANGLMSEPAPASALMTNQFIDYANDFDRAAFIARVKKMRT